MAKEEQGCVFATGDVVMVAEGELANLLGRVVAVEGGRVTVLPRHEDLKVSLIENCCLCSSDHLVRRVIYA